MLIGIPLPDWITLTTFDEQTYKSVMLVWQKAAHSHAERDGRSLPLVRQKVMQYDGLSIDGVFFGAGRQGGEPHFMVRVSGETSHRLWTSVKLHGFKCTRVDLQVTIEQPPLYDTIALVEQLAASEWRGRKSPKIHAYYSTDGMDTVYVGSRQSERFLRIYVKADEDGFRYLRYEMEIKGVAANNVYRAMLEDYGGTVSGVLADSVRRIDKRVYTVRYFRAELEAYEGKKVDGRVVRAKGATMEWLRNQVEPAIRKLANEHDSRQQVLDWLAALSKDIAKDEELSQAIAGGSESAALGLGIISNDDGIVGAFGDN